MAQEEIVEEPTIVRVSNELRVEWVNGKPRCGKCAGKLERVFTREMEPMVRCMNCGSMKVKGKTVEMEFKPIPPSERQRQSGKSGGNASVLSENRVGNVGKKYGARDKCKRRDGNG